jgi:hypothetical protein
MGNVTAARIIERLCVPIGETASAWTSRERDNHTLHAGFVSGVDGPEFADVCGAYDSKPGIVLLPDGGEWPYSYSLCSPDELAMIDYCEGDIAVRAYRDENGYRKALAAYHPSAVEHGMK